MVVSNLRTVRGTTRHYRRTRVKKHERTRTCRKQRRLVRSHVAYGGTSSLTDLSFISYSQQYKTYRSSNSISSGIDTTQSKRECVFVSPDIETAKFYARLGAVRDNSLVEFQTLHTFEFIKPCHFFNFYDTPSVNTLLDIYKCRATSDDDITRINSKIFLKQLCRSLVICTTCWYNIPPDTMYYSDDISSFNRRIFCVKCWKQCRNQVSLTPATKLLNFRFSRCDEDLEISQELCKYFSENSIECDGFCCLGQDSLPELMICKPALAIKAAAREQFPTLKVGSRICTLHGTGTVQRIIEDKTLYLYEIQYISPLIAYYIRKPYFVGAADTQALFARATTTRPSMVYQELPVPHELKSLGHIVTSKALLKTRYARDYIQFNVESETIYFKDINSIISVE